MAYAQDSAPFVAGTVRSDARPPRDPLSDFIASQPASRLASLSRFLTAASAALLLLTGVLGILSAFHDMKTALSSVLLSIYSCGFGTLLLRHYLASGAREDALRARYGFMYTHAGRTAFLLLSANLTWSLEPFGWVVAVFVNASAVLLGYILYAHPALAPDSSTDGHTLGDFDADPATLAARAQAMS